MRLAFIRKKYAFHGGAEGFSQALMSQLLSAGHEIHLYAIAWADAPSSEIVLHHVPAVTWSSFLRDLTFALRTRSMLQKESYDIIQSHDKTLLQDIYRAGDGCHMEWLRQRWPRTGLAGKLSMIFNPYHWLILILERMIFTGHRYRKIIAISDMVKRNIIEHYRVPAGDIEVIYNGVDLVKFHIGNRGRYREEIRRQYGLTEEDFVILFVGSGFERKGVKYLIRAVESIREPVTVLIVGKGPAQRYRVKGGRQKVLFCGPRKHIEQYYAAADIFVFPTIYEPFGNVHLEALASGLPVITTSNSGAAEIIEHGVNGFVVERPEDVGQIAEKIGVLMDARTRETMSRKARILAEKFSFARYTDTIMRLYDRVIHHRKVGAEP